MTKPERWKAAVEDAMPAVLARLKDYVSRPSVSAQKKGIGEAARFAAALIAKAGGRAKILKEPGANPLVYGFFPAGTKGNPAKTLLFYNHYDVQPPEPLAEWDTFPFSAEVRDGRLFGRGTADNKADFVARLQAVQIVKDSEGGLPCHIKFLVEGEEEIGSPNLERYLKKYADLFRADGCIWEFGGKNEKGQLEIACGVKGIAYFELTCRTADADIHSSAGAIIDNAAWRLVRALASMKNAEHEILVEGFSDGIREPAPEEREAAKKLPFDEKVLRDVYGLKRPLITGKKGIDPREAMVFHPTMTICGIWSGYTGEGTKTVLPKEAKAKIDCRLVPEQDPAHVFACIQKHLAAKGFADIQVEWLNGQRAHRSDLKDPFIRHVIRSAAEAYGREAAVWPNAGGTGPMHLFGRYLHVPIASVGVGWYGSRAHAPNENIRLSDLQEGILFLVHLLSGLSLLWPPENS